MKEWRPMWQKIRGMPRARVVCALSPARAEQLDYMRRLFFYEQACIRKPYSETHDPWREQ